MGGQSKPTGLAVVVKVARFNIDLIEGFSSMEGSSRALCAAQRPAHGACRRTRAWSPSTGKSMLNWSPKAPNPKAEITGITELGEPETLSWLVDLDPLWCPSQEPAGAPEGNVKTVDNIIEIPSRGGQR